MELEDFLVRDPLDRELPDTLGQLRIVETRVVSFRNGTRFDVGSDEPGPIFACAC
jgi:hypothetical protein